MKQSEIDRWMRRQARRDSNKLLPAMNWVWVITLLMISVAGLYLILRLTHMG